MQALDIAAFGARAHATCSFCSHQKFRIVIFDKGGWEPRCSKCRHPWQAPEQQEALKLDCDAAVEGSGDVASGDVAPDVVPPPSREESEAVRVGNYYLEGAIEDMKARETRMLGAQPWRNQGVSRATWYRRRAKLAAMETNAKQLRQRIAGEA